MCDSIREFLLLSVLVLVTRRRRRRRRMFQRKEAKPHITDVCLTSLSTHEQCYKDSLFWGVEGGGYSSRLSLSCVHTSWLSLRLASFAIPISHVAFCGYPLTGTCINTCRLQNFPLKVVHKRENGTVELEVDKPKTNTFSFTGDHTSTVHTTLFPHLPLQNIHFSLCFSQPYK